MPDTEYIYPDVSCSHCHTKRGITLSNGIVGCSICGNEVAKARRHITVNMKETIKLSSSATVTKNP